MRPVNDSVQRFQMVFDLFDAALDLIRQNTLRANPNATEEEIEAKIQAWLQDRPGAPHGDSPGIPYRWADWIAKNEPPT